MNWAVRNIYGANILKQQLYGEVDLVGETPEDETEKFVQWQSV